MYIFASFLKQRKAIKKHDIYVGYFPGAIWSHWVSYADQEQHTAARY